MALDAVTPLTRLGQLAANLTGMSTAQVFIGVPNAIGPQVAAYITLSGHVTVDDTASNGRLFARTQRYTVTFVYQVEEAEDAAETTMAGLVDAFILALYAERRVNGSPLASLEFPPTFTEGAEYEAILGQEYRRYPITVAVTQRHNLVA